MYHKIHPFKMNFNHISRVFRRYSQDCAAITTAQIQNIFITSRRNSRPSAVTPHSLLPPPPFPVSLFCNLTSFPLSDLAATILLNQYKLQSPHDSEIHEYWAYVKLHCFVLVNSLLYFTLADENINFC